MNQGVVSKLEGLHLGRSEAVVYATLLEIGQTSAGEVIKKTGLHRAIAYDALEKLIARKLVSKLKKSNITYFQPLDPERLLAGVKAEYELAQELVPQLRHLVDLTQPEIIVHEGVDSYRRFWLDSVQKLPVGSTDHVAGSVINKWLEWMGNDYKKYHRIRLQRKIKWQAVVFSTEGLELDLLRDHPELHDYRFLDKPVEKYGNFNVWGEDTLILHAATEPLVIEIKNITLAKVFRNIFDILWDLGKPLG